MDGVGLLSEPETTDTDADLLDDNPFTTAASAAAPPGAHADVQDQTHRVGRAGSEANPLCTGCGVR